METQSCKEFLTNLGRLGNGAVLANAIRVSISLVAETIITWPADVKAGSPSPFKRSKVIAVSGF